MSRTMTVLTALVAAVALSIGMAPAHSQEGKVLSPPGSIDSRVLKSEAVAGSAIPRPDPAAETAVANLQANVSRWVKTNGPKYTFATYLDATTGRIVFKSDAPRDVVASLLDASKVSAEVSPTRVVDLYSRKADIPSYWGGAGITLTTGSPWCSSGFTVQNGLGTRFLTTAGHCFDNGNTVRTELGGLNMGTVSGKGLASGFDMERIGGSSYWGYIYTGGTNSSTGMPVVGAGDSVVGYTNYCHSGRTTGENCGHTSISNSAQVCTQSGCKFPVTAFTGGNLPQGGDSGSPFYVKSSTSVWIRGMIIAGDGTTSYAEKYSRISSFLGATIVTA